jgi:hypothetical protein
LIQGWSKRILTLRGLKENGFQRIGKSRGGWNTKIHAVTVGARGMVAFRLSGGNVPDAVEDGCCWKPSENRTIRLIS